MQVRTLPAGNSASRFRASPISILAFISFPFSIFTIRVRSRFGAVHNRRIRLVLESLLLLPLARLV